MKLKNTKKDMKKNMRHQSIKFLLFLIVTLLMIPSVAYAQLSEDNIRSYLKDSAELVNENSLYNPDLLSEFLETHLSDSFRLVDYATVVISGQEQQQPVVRNKQAYIEEALGSLDNIIKVDPKLEISFVKVRNGGKLGRAKYTLKTISKVKDPQLAELYGTELFQITTNSQCDEEFTYSKNKEAVQSEKLTCKSRIELNPV